MKERREKWCSRREGEREIENEEREKLIGIYEKIKMREFIAANSFQSEGSKFAIVRFLKCVQFTEK